MKNKFLILPLSLALLLSSCQTKPAANTVSPSVNPDLSENTTSQTNHNTNSTPTTGDYSEKALNASWHAESASTITFTNNTIKSSDKSISIKDKVLTITEGGTYVFTGSLTDGQIIVDAKEDENVQLVLKDVEFTSAQQSAIFIKTAKNVFLTVAEGTTNTISDSSNYTIAEDGSSDTPDAAIYSKTDLIINGTGTLTVNGNYQDAIHSKDDLEIIGTTLIIQAVSDGIKGKDSICIHSGNFTITAGVDAFKANNSNDGAKGYIIIDGGTFMISAGSDGMEAISHLVINDGTISITKSCEGLEGQNITIAGGTIDIVSTDDGINICGTKSSSMKTEKEAFGQKPMGGGFDETTEGMLLISGGTLTVTAEGDGLDSNGSIQMTGGSVTVFGPTNDGNGSLDYNGTFLICGGTLITAGSSGMAQTTSADSTQTCIATSFQPALAANSKVFITDSDGKEICSFSPTKTYSFLLVSSPDLVTGNTYTIKAGDSTTTVTAGDTSNVQNSMGDRHGRKGMRGR